MPFDCAKSILIDVNFNDSRIEVSTHKSDSTDRYFNIGTCKYTFRKEVVVILWHSWLVKTKMCY